MSANRIPVGDYPASPSYSNSLHPCGCSFLLSPYMKTGRGAWVECKSPCVWPCQHFICFVRADKLIAYADRPHGVWSQDPQLLLGRSHPVWGLDDGCSPFPAPLLRWREKHHQTVAPEPVALTHWAKGLESKWKDNKCPFIYSLSEII